MLPANLDKLMDEFLKLVHSFHSETVDENYKFSCKVLDEASWIAHHAELQNNLEVWVKVTHIKESWQNARAQWRNAIRSF
jgi:pterin-4a-carbinolamine dehydratase